MDIDIWYWTIMTTTNIFGRKSMTSNYNFFLFPTNTDDSKSSVAAKLQNAITCNSIPPPIGVFWDIENIQVPKGRSAIALVQKIRERFFKNHREAEFMCVCDINKESKNVIEELLFAQVTVVHISATSKNAADDKLKQCMKRFVDTYGAPSTLILVSGDMNFSSDLSDFRHRHNIHIILISRGNCHPSLLSCAHEHFNFSTLIRDLPIRSPNKANNRPNELEITNLPNWRPYAQIRGRLQKLSSNCGGKVISISDRRAVIRFANGEAAERAKKRMDNENVFGSYIAVCFRARGDSDLSDSPARDQFKDSNSSDESIVISTPCSSRASSPSIPDEQDNACGKRKLNFPPPPVICGRNLPTMLLEERNNFSASNDIPLPFSNNFKSMHDHKIPVLEWNAAKGTSHKNQGSSAFTPVHKGPRYITKNSDLTNGRRGSYSSANVPADTKKYSQRNVGRVSPFVLPESKPFARNISTNDNGRQVPNQVDVPTSSFHAPNFPALSQGFTAPFSDIQRISDPMTYAHWASSLSMSFNQGQSVVGRASGFMDSGSAVELYVCNLDSSFEINEIKRILLSVFSDYVMVIHISMSIQPDGSAKATVKVPSLQQAQIAISKLQRKKIGHKRILISYATSERAPPFHVLRSETIALLNDIPAKSLPLIKFRELYEKRYHRAISASELYKMRDAVVIQGDSGNRMVYLNPDYCRTPSVADSEESHIDLSNLEKSYCERHFRVSESQGWAEQYTVLPVPLVYISLKDFSQAVHKLLDSHQGSVPLISFGDCYEAEIGHFPIVGNYGGSHDSYNDSEIRTTSPCKGVPLEHLVACVTGVEVTKSVMCIKKVQWLGDKTLGSQSDFFSPNFNPLLASQLTQFGREVMDMLKSQPQCLVAFNKFIPTYHHHFGKQCRVADYGFTKLIDLLESISHVVQVIGEGQSRQVTLTHKVQVKRFSSELLRILRSKTSKQLSVAEFAIAYEQVIEKKFDIINYGVCEIEDMLNEMPDSVILISKMDGEIMLNIPKRDQTAEEIERTKQFALEVLNIMTLVPNCEILFNKFIPVYHHHYNKQCRVLDYGFTKLIELFEALPDILDIKGTGEDRLLRLVVSEKRKILAERLVTIVNRQQEKAVNVEEINRLYSESIGIPLRPNDFDFRDIMDLLQSMQNKMMIISNRGLMYLAAFDSKLVRQLSFNVRRILMDQIECKISVKQMEAMYNLKHKEFLNVFQLRMLTDAVQVDEQGSVYLTPFHILARSMIIVMQDSSDGSMTFSDFVVVYQRKLGLTICAAQYGSPSLLGLLEKMTDYFIINKRINRIELAEEFRRAPLPVVHVSYLQAQLHLLNQKTNAVKNIQPPLTNNLQPVITASNMQLPLTSNMQLPLTSNMPPLLTNVMQPPLASNMQPLFTGGMHYSRSNMLMNQPNLPLFGPIATVVPQLAPPIRCDLYIPQVAMPIHSTPGRSQIGRIFAPNSPAVGARAGPPPCQTCTPAALQRDESKSVEDLAKAFSAIHSEKERDVPSSKSTPTRPSQRRCRIAAHFSTPID